MALGSTHPLIEMSSRNLIGSKGRPAHKAESLTTTREPIVWKMRELRRLTTLWAFTSCYRDSFTLKRRDRRRLTTLRGLHILLQG
jgi:hypothetical protein